MFSNTRKVNDVYIKSYATSATKKENHKELGYHFDYIFDDLYCHTSTYEKAQEELLKFSVNYCLAKAKCSLMDMEMIISGDLMNQLMATYYGLKNAQIPLIGIYSACSTSALGINLASLLIQKRDILVCSCSHYAAVEKQFRYPNEYGIQRKETTTTTVSGAGSLIISKDKSKIKICSCTFGVVQDIDYKDVNDMGGVMAVAAYHTIIQHFKDTNYTFKDYDIILTGDLGVFGLSILRRLFVEHGYKQDELDRIYDGGVELYKNDKDTYMGGSGCACSILNLCGKYLPLIEKKQIQSILYVATGALHTPIALFQKESIPVIAHACEIRGV